MLLALLPEDFPASSPAVLPPAVPMHILRMLPIGALAIAAVKLLV